MLYKDIVEYMMSGCSKVSVINEHSNEPYVEFSYSTPQRAQAGFKTMKLQGYQPRMVSGMDGGDGRMFYIKVKRT